MRKNFSKKERFEILQRDRFTCQYCGMRAPDVILHIDHVVPLAKGGSNEFDNLKVACQSCNSGKGVTLVEVNNLNINPKYREILSDKKEYRPHIDDIKYSERFADQIYEIVFPKFVSLDGAEMTEWLIFACCWHGVNYGYLITKAKESDTYAEFLTAIADSIIAYSKELSSEMLIWYLPEGMVNG